MSEAHHQGGAHEGAKNGIIIPALSHGQMAVVAEHRAAIMDLATEQYPTDPVQRRLQTYVNLQYFACAWGLAPGSLSDENSPFNECTHAYLAGARALLVHLGTMPGGAVARALAATVDGEMSARHASLAQCRFSGEAFNTAEIIPPHWSGVATHGPTLLTLLGAILATLGAAWLGVQAVISARANTSVGSA